jgi:hypothetical protein
MQLQNTTLEQSMVQIREFPQFISLSLSFWVNCIKIKLTLIKILADVMDLS